MRTSLIISALIVAPTPGNISSVGSAVIVAIALAFAIFLDLTKS